LQTLRNAIAWSYDLLAPAEQALFRQLAVFVGGFSPSLAEAVCRRSRTSVSVLDGLGSLVDNSLLSVLEQPDGETRFSMLDTLREYAAELLVAGFEADELRARHAEVFLQLAEEAEPHLVSSARDAWLRRLETEYENLRTALTWLLEHHQGRKACRLAGALRWFWDFQGRVDEGRRWLERSLESADARDPSAERLKALLSGGHLASLLGDEESARRWLGEGVSIARDVDDRLALANGLMYLAFLDVDLDEPERARYEDEALAVLYELKDTWWSALALLGTGMTALRRGDRAIARLRLEESLQLWEQLGDAWFTAQALNALGDMARTQADDSRAAELYSRSLALLRRHGITTSIAASVLHNLGYIAHHLHDRRQAMNRSSRRWRSSPTRATFVARRSACSAWRSRFGARGTSRMPRGCSARVTGCWRRLAVASGRRISPKSSRRTTRHAASSATTHSLVPGPRDAQWSSTVRCASPAN
jgi:hypothetical protein